MRTENQIKRKLNELMMRKESLVSKEDAATAEQIDRLDEQILLLEWVLNEPTGTYHG
ncbi:hypothetical protein [Paenibacillus thermotolerans]|uniref:hypothetical protein n=1 Tax=Paenibacillus thermotolerans TaxID=3027807 RepID=UPI0023689C3E|nr:MULTISPECIES: hypothetical protein [unclassified Paenibacillus]